MERTSVLLLPPLIAVYNQLLFNGGAVESFDEAEENDGASAEGVSASSDLPLDMSLDPMELEEASES